MNHGLWTQVWFTAMSGSLLRNFLLETLDDASFKTVICTLEFQFDTVINDRSIILHHYQNFIQYYYSNSSIKILSWEFFLNCFDILSIKSQISMEESG
jgi:hypothetical protein